MSFKEEEGNKKGVKRRITQACILCRRKKVIFVYVIKA
jgi:hypothetical protein